MTGTTFTNFYNYDVASNRTGYTALDGSTNTYSCYNPDARAVVMPLRLRAQ